MQESKSCALPLGDSPLKTLFLTLHASLNYKRKGWVVGLEPTISRTTIWRANQLHHTHHNEPGGIRTLDLRLRRPLLYPAELQTHFNIPFSKGSPYFYGKAGDGNRTHVSSLEGWCSTIELHPHVSLFFCVPQDKNYNITRLHKMQPLFSNFFNFFNYI